MTARFQITAHPSSDLLETYALRQLSPNQRDAIEDHLYLCEECRLSLEEIEEFITALRAASPDRKLLVRAIFRPVNRIASLNLSLGIGLAGALAALILLFAPIWHRPTPRASAPAVVHLSSLRGGEIPTISRADARGRLDLRLEAADLSSPEVQVAEIVKGNGITVWNGTPVPHDGQFSMIVAKPLEAGIYWIRLRNGRGELVREYGVRIR